MSNVLLENASSGRFLITTDNPGCKEAVDNEQTGFIYHGGDVDALENAVIKFLQMDNQQRKSMGQAGRDKVKKEFSRQIVIDAYLKKIQQLVK